MKNIKEVCRKCTGCGQIVEKSRLLRIVRNRNGQIFADESGYAEGRGAYICLNPECIERASKKNGLERSFRAKINTEDKERIFKEISDIERRKGRSAYRDGD